MPISRRDLLKGTVVVPGLIVTGVGSIEREGSRLWTASHDNHLSGAVFLYGRVSVEEQAFHATDEQIQRNVQLELAGLQRDFMQAIARYRKQGWPVHEDRGERLPPDAAFYRT